MSDVRSITLEFLRKGPAHNQLLSPLVDYLAVLGDHKVSSINVPYNDHAEFLSALKVLSDTKAVLERPQEVREVLNDTGTKMAKLLGTVDGFTEELKKPLANDQLLHLKIVISVSELALLPFELTKVPGGTLATTETDWLALVPSPRVCITRQIRTVTGDNVLWPGKPRILFVWAEPELEKDLTVPKEAHKEALLEAVRPWIPYCDPTKPDDAERSAREKQLLTILPNATFERIKKACSEAAASEKPYTHVHILAHGSARSDASGSPIGISLHGTGQSNRVDTILGSDFAKAFGSHLPTVVTVAACNTASIRSVVYETGVSFAHDLHRAGIPLVIASQFPLSAPGSIDMVKILYKGLLWSEDPRRMLPELRRTLSKDHSDYHDWASLVAYTALPHDLENQLVDARYAIAKAAIDAALNHADVEIQNAYKTAEVDGLRAAIPRWRDRVAEAKKNMPLEKKYGYETEGVGMLGSADKRIAEALFNVCCISKASEYPEFLDQSIAALEESLKKYELAFHANIQESRDMIRVKRSVHWVLCQCLSLSAVLGKPLSRELWGMARVAAELDTQVPAQIDTKGEIRTWGHGTLWELYFLVLAYNNKTFSVDHEDARTEAERHVRRVGDLGTFDDHFPIKSTRRQIDRYRKWWCHDALNSRFKNARERDWNEKGGVKELADHLATLLPPN